MYFCLREIYGIPDVCMLGCGTGETKLGGFLPASSLPRWLLVVFVVPVLLLAGRELDDAWKRFETMRWNCKDATKLGKMRISHVHES